MSAAFTFWTPAHLRDFADDAAKQQALDALWHTNLVGFTRQGILGNPWSSTFASNQVSYFNPADAPYGASAAILPITWNAFPGRIAFYYGQAPTAADAMSATDQLSLADTGYTAHRGAFPPITTDPCANPPPAAFTSSRPYGPYGPRGWLDEYCEWCVTCNAVGKIVRVSFTCENPEYWCSLWIVDPKRVLALYQELLGRPEITLADLTLTHKTGKPVVDPSTGQPAYNPLNKWNSGTRATSTGGGAVHLTATPNTLQTEIALATGASVLRDKGPWTKASLICCSQYGQAGRNSDPTIGFAVNGAVAPDAKSANGYQVTLANPPGLYIQMPDFGQYTTPDNTPAQTFWKVVRGARTLVDHNGVTLPGNFILHATFEVPASLGYTVSDIQINNVPIAYAGQIAQTFNMHILAARVPSALPAAPPRLACMGSPDTSLAQPLQLLHADVFDACYNASIPTAAGVPASLAGNTTLIAPVVKPGEAAVSMMLVCSTVTPGPRGELPVVTVYRNGVADPRVRVEVRKLVGDLQYTIPGNSYPSANQGLVIAVSVAADAAPGLYDVGITSFAQGPAAPMPALLAVAPRAHTA